MIEDYVILLLQDFDFERIINSYPKYRSDIKVIGKKKDKISSNELQRKLNQINKYQEELQTMKDMIVNRSTDFPLKGYKFKEWAIENYEKFVKSRERYGI